MTPSLCFQARPRDGNDYCGYVFALSRGKARALAMQSEDGQWHWREGCDDCTRRTRPDPADGVVEPPAVVWSECDLRVEP